MKIIAIGGEPGAGKSTLMKELLNVVSPEKNYENVKLVPFLSKNNIVYFLGKYDADGYIQGTDKMSMACQPAVIDWMKTISPESTVLFEGDRLFSKSFLEHCLDNYDLQIYHLKTDKDIRNKRYIDRGSNQNSTWLSGRETKINNILTNLTLMFSINTFHNNTFEEQQHIINRILLDINYD